MHARVLLATVLELRLYTARLDNADADVPVGAQLACKRIGPALDGKLARVVEGIAKVSCRGLESLLDGSGRRNIELELQDGFGIREV